MNSTSPAPSLGPAHDRGRDEDCLVGELFRMMTLPAVPLLLRTIAKGSFLQTKCMSL